MAMKEYPYALMVLQADRVKLKISLRIRKPPESSKDQKASHNQDVIEVNSIQWTYSKIVMSFPNTGIQPFEFLK